MIDKNAGDNLILGCEDSKYNEWPQVGDEVQTSAGKGNVELLPDSIGNYIVEINGVFFPMLIDELQKPKTPEEELRDEMIEHIASKIKITNHPIKQAEILFDEFNITKKPQ